MFVDPATQPSRCAGEEFDRGCIPSQTRNLAPDRTDELAWQAVPSPGRLVVGYRELDDNAKAITTDAPLSSTITKLVWKPLGPLVALTVGVRTLRPWS